MTAMHRRWSPSKSGGARNPVQSVTSPRQPGRYPAAGYSNPKGKVSPIWGTPAASRVPQHKEPTRETTLPMSVPDTGNGDLDPEAVAELRRLARSRPRSGREPVAKASALRALERLRRGKRQVPPMPEGWYPHEPGDPLYELDWVFLHQHPEILKRHWEMAWRRGECECPVATPAAPRLRGLLTAA